MGLTSRGNSAKVFLRHQFRIREKINCKQLKSNGYILAKPGKS